MKFFLPKHIVVLILTLCFSLTAFGQSYIKDMARDSARSDSRTGGTIEKAELNPDDLNLRLTVNVPSFEMTLWQADSEIRKYHVGVGLKDYPIFVGLRDIGMIIWNPSWIPPESDWVAPELQGLVIGPADPRNPLGKIKIPLGYGYLIHQAKGVGDLGSLVSHGCVRVMRDDLYDLNDNLLFANGMDLSKDVAASKRNKTTFVIEIDEPVKLEITYDTMVVEAGVLRIYPDIYDYDKNTVANLRTELQSNGIDDFAISDSILKQMIAKATGKSMYEINLSDISDGKYLEGKVLLVVPKPKR